MKTTRYTITSKKVIAFALALVLLATVFTGCNRTNEEETTTTTTTEVQTTIEFVTEIVTDENGETVTNDNGEALTIEVTKVVEVTGQSEEATSNKTTTISTPKKNETTTKKNTSTGSTNKVITTKPVTTTKPDVTTTKASCNHNWVIDTYNNGFYVYECSKCKESKLEEKAMNPDDFMGNKSEYLELLGYVNQARREAGLNELVYITEWQSGANQRAKDLTKTYSHKRPDGSHFLTAYNGNPNYNSQYGSVWCGGGENIVSGAKTAKQAFDAWMNSSGHRETILNANSTGIVIARCDTYWVMNTFASVE